MERMIRNHEKKMQVLKLKGEQWIEENKIKNDIQLSKLKAEKDQLSVNKDIREIKTEVKQDKAIIKAGTFLNMWGTIGTGTSTLLTIAGLWSFFNSSYLKAISFILAIIITQFTVYILAKQDTNIKRHFMQHAFKASILKVTLLSISIYGNYTFFTTGRNVNFIGVVTTLALCIAIDVISIYCISIAQDFRTLNKNVSKDSMYKGLLGKIVFNFTYKFISEIENKYHINKSGLTFVQDKETVKKIDYKQDRKESISNIDMDKDSNTELSYKQDSKVLELSDFVQDKDKEIIKEAILNNNIDNVCPSISTLMELTGFSKNKVIAIKKALELEGIIETVGKKTLIK